MTAAAFALVSFGACADPVNQRVADEYIEANGSSFTSLCRQASRTGIDRDGIAELVLAATGKEWFIDRGADPNSTTKLIADECFN